MADTYTADAVAAATPPECGKPRWERPVIEVLNVRETLNGGFDIVDGGVTSAPMS
ncbi:hypothetical protein [Magnetospirillum sp. 64-120]|uniref:hypothetical protein n=1 Tax=Magnetospirillum sp. 64-120 TaxID=1895778 RepID=UPI0025C55F81|nr:hypothetical protein [Magnetospirillum sp. 64-120]